MAADFGVLSELRNGRPPKWEKRQFINGIYDVNRTGCQWRMLPVNISPCQTVYGYYWRWSCNGVWEQINKTLVHVGVNG